MPEEIEPVYRKPNPSKTYGISYALVTKDYVSKIIKERKFNIFEYIKALRSSVLVDFKRGKATSYFLYKINKHGKHIAARNKNTETEVLHKLSQESDDIVNCSILISLAKNESTPVNVFKNILKATNSIYVIESIVRNTSAPACILEDIVQKYVSSSYLVSQKYLVYSLLEHQNIPEYLRRHLGQLYEKIIENEYINYKWSSEESIFIKYNV